jgi:hypothetical protein
MYTTGDTAINSQLYKILFAETGSSCIYGYMREDTATRKIYFLDVLGNQESLLYDFSMQVGDSIQVAFYWSSGYFANGYYRLDSITSMMTLAGLRRVFNLNCHTCGFSTTLMWVEGVGNLGDVVYSYSTNNTGYQFYGSCPYFPHDFDHFVSCFDHNVKVYYDSCAYATALLDPCFAVWDTCNYWNICGAVNEINSISSFQISPNPAHDNFTVSFNGEMKDYNGQLKIYDVMGRLMKEREIHSQLSTVNCQLSAGVYFVKVDNGNKTFVQKLVIR